MCNFDNQISMLTQSYVFLLLPSIYLWGHCDILRKFLNCCGKNFYPMISFLISSAMFPFVAYYLTITLQWKIKGIAVAITIQNLNTLILMQLLFYLDKDLKKACTLPNHRAARNLREYLQIALPNILLQILTWWSYQLLVVLSGLLGDVD